MGDHPDLTFLELVEAKIAENPQGTVSAMVSTVDFPKKPISWNQSMIIPTKNPMKSTGFTMMISQYPNEMQP